MGPGAAAGLGDGTGRHLGGEAEDGRSVGEVDVVTEGTLAGPDGVGHHGGHPGLTLQAGHRRILLGADLDAVDDPGDGGQGDTALAERGQDVLDVPEEEGVRADHENALALQGEAVGIEEIGGPVECHRCLARARSALDHEDTGEGGPDDLVLLPLDRRDDVAHVAGPGPLQGGQERPGSSELEGGLVGGGGGPGAVVGREVGVAVQGLAAEVLVLDADDPATVGGQVAAEDQVHRLTAGGPVERLGHRGPPVHHQGVDVVSGDPEATDVEALDGVVVGPAVDAAEAEGLLPDVELVESGQAGPDDDVPLFAELMGPAPALVEDGPEELLGVGPELIQPFVGAVDVGLFRLQLRMCAHSRSLSLLRAVNPRSYRRVPGCSHGSPTMGTR